MIVERIIKIKRKLPLKITSKYEMFGICIQNFNSIESKHPTEYHLMVIFIIIFSFNIFLHFVEKNKNKKVFETKQKWCVLNGRPKDQFVFFFFFFQRKISLISSFSIDFVIIMFFLIHFNFLFFSSFVIRTE